MRSLAIANCCLLALKRTLTVASSNRSEVDSIEAGRLRPFAIFWMWARPSGDRDGAEIGGKVIT